jgi:ketosteroid isomerase-like protein
MKRLGLVVLAVAACQHAQTAVPPAAPTPPRPLPREAVLQVKQVIEDWRKAYEKRDIEALEALYTHDDDTLVVADGVPYITWASVEPALKNRMAMQRELHIQLKEVQVSKLGPDAAAAVATMSRDSGDATTTVHEYGALSLALTKTDAGWKIAAEHYSYRRGTQQ